MDFLPLFFDLKSSTALVFGASSLAVRKIELLNKAGCKVVNVRADDQNEALDDTLEKQSTSLVECIASANEDVWASAHLVVAATGNDRDDAELAEKAKSLKLPVNVVNNAALSSFVFPSIIDRSPIIAAVSSSGELPVLTRLLRSRLESTIPHAYGRMAEIAKRYRSAVKERISGINNRRRFWEHNLEGRFSELVFSGEETLAEEHLKTSLDNFGSEDRSKGEVYLVGAGPGDPDLLTFKALRLIRQADIVLFDRLVSDEIMALVRQDAEKINVGKERSNHTVPQESINDLLVNYAKKGLRVLRLKGGDPFVFGRGGEEIETLSEQGVSFQVVPGITAASGCAAYSGIPLTHRDYSQSVRFITGHLKNDSCDLPWSEFVHERQTLVFYMGLSGLETISRSLIAHGMAADKPAALISKGTTPEQKVIVGTIDTIYKLSQEHNVKAPTIIIVGDVVSLHSKLNWRPEN